MGELTNINNDNAKFKLSPAVGCLAAIVVVLVAFIVISKCFAPQLFEVVRHNDDIELTPTQISEIKSSNSWCFYQVEIGPMRVDTISGFANLSRFYYGTLHIGVDINKAADNWIVQSDDTVYVSLPPIEVLDDEFIDESRTTTFDESHVLTEWSNDDYAALLAKAHRQMLSVYFSPANIATAKHDGRQRMTDIVRSFGINGAIVVTFSEK